MVTEDPRQSSGALAILRRAFLLLTAALALPGAALPARAQLPAPPPTPPRIRPRIALVLSGGSAKGLAHIGVLRVLQEAGVPIDLVTGASMGALVGGLYAIGYSPADLARLGTTIDWTSLFQDTFDARPMPMAQMDVVARPLITLPITDGKVGLPQSLIAGQRIAELLDRLTWPAQTMRDFHRLPIPFEAVATDIATGKPVVLDHGSLAGALEASMAIPTIFRPVEVDGRTLIDGGWSQNLPAQEARAMGADVVICSDVSDQLLSASEIHDLVDVLMQTVTFQINASRPEQRRNCDIYVRPDPNGMSAFSFNRASTWIARGDSAARAVWPALRQLAATAAAPSGATPPVNADVPVPVHASAVRVEAPSPAAERAVRRLLRLGPGRVTPSRLERAVERVYASGMYGRVWYELQAAGADTVVVVHAEAREANRVGFGFRYDERYDASLLFTATLRSLLGYGSETRVDARLGEQLQFGVRTVRRGVLSSPLTVGGSASYTRSPFDLFRDGYRVTSADVVVNAASLTVGLELLGDAGIAAQAAAERVGGQRIFASVDSTGPRERTVASVSALAWWSALDREEFPRQGVSLFARAEGAFGSGAPFTHGVADVRAAVPLDRRLTLQARATAGATIGAGAIPVTYRFFLGGSTASGAFPETQLTFLGLQPQERMGNAASRVEGALQWEAVPNVFASLAADAGNVAPTLRHTLDRPIVGAGVSLGSQTILGPINLTVSGRSLGQWPRVGVNIGYIF